ncbi:MAG: DUF4326 domain-containing protein [Anaerolineae bacterium]|nr:DUF4326 domain-containing protein [Anaerolineae bacterium]
MNIRIGSVTAGDEGEYIGRAFHSREASPLANPFPITKQQDRDTAIRKYRVWLYEKIKRADDAVLTELGRLLAIAQKPGGLTLVCWCRSVEQTAPECHGDVIKAALEWIAQDPVAVAAVEMGAAIRNLGLG